MDMSNFSVKDAELSFTSPSINPDDDKKIEEIKKTIKEEEKKSKESKRDRLLFSEDDPGAPVYNVSLEHEKAKLKKLEAKRHKRPNESGLSSLDHRMWKFFLPVFYCNASFSERKLSSFPHKMPYKLHEKWKECTDDHVFESYEIRSTRPDAYLQYFALFGYRGPTCWLIAHWNGSKTRTHLTDEEIKSYSLEKLKGIHYTRTRMFAMATLAGILGILALFAGLPTLNFWLNGIGACLIILCIAICTTWKQVLETELSPEEEQELLIHLAKTP